MFQRKDSTNRRW